MTYKRKLIEVALPLGAINAASRAGKHVGSRPHPQTLHRWWARRPLEAARAVLWSSLVDDPSAHPDQFPTEELQEVERQRLFRILEELVKPDHSQDRRTLDAAHAEIVASCDGDLPNILDPFCGGGTIPLEAQRLGLHAYGGDLNPVAVLISKAMVEIPPRFAGLPPVNPDARANEGLRTWERAEGLADDVRYYGERMRDRVRERVGHLYPNVELPPEQGGGEATVIAWIWARTVESPDPSWNGHVPLVKSWVLRKAKKNKPVVWIEPIVDRTTQTITYRIREGGAPTEGTVARGKGRCIATGAPIAGDYIKAEGEAGRMSAVGLAVVAESRTGKRYIESQTSIQTTGDLWRPRGAVPERLTGGTCYGFGLTEWGDLFADRQLAILEAFVEALSEVEAAIAGDGAGDGVSAFGRRPDLPTYAESVVTYLALTISKSTEYWNSLCSWNSSNEQIRNTFARQGLAMTWDYVEANPLGESMGSWHSMLGWVVRAITAMPAGIPGHIAQRDAAARIAEIDSPVICTDPPYYDNISYSDLSDFFYVWLRESVGALWKDEFSTVAAPKAEELIANRHRAGSAEKAREFFESGMQTVFRKVAQHQRSDFPITVFYAFKQEEADSLGTASTGWESFISALLDAGLALNGTWPIRTEMAARTVAQGTAALASSIVLVCRPRPVDASLATRSEFVAALRSDLPDAVRLLQRESIAPVDMAQSAIGPGMAVFSRYAKVIEADGSDMSVRQALMLINEVLQETLSAEETEFDPDTRWALTWFEQFGLNPGPYGDAETLSKAKNTSAAGVVAAGIAIQRGGDVRLLDRGELDPDWDPTDDLRLTVWEVAQYLIRALGVSESDAAALLRLVGSGLGEQARQLAYLLYQVADRKGWSEEAVAYNGLVQAWPDLTRLAAQTSGPVQTTLGE